MDFLCLDFINSQWYRTHKTFCEPLRNEEWFKNFSMKWKLPAVNIQNEEFLNSLFELRDILRLAVEDLCTKKLINTEGIDKINEYMANFPLSKVLRKEADGYKLYIMPQKLETDQIIFEIISSFVQMITEYEIERIKLCENPDCRWVFYDESKSHTRKWCDNTCATLMKVRRFRQNKKIML